jgi:lipopolysaccharide biosynthesis protein
VLSISDLLEAAQTWRRFARHIARLSAVRVLSPTRARIRQETLRPPIIMRRAAVEESMPSMGMVQHPARGAAALTHFWETLG